MRFVGPLILSGLLQVRVEGRIFWDLHDVSMVLKIRCQIVLKVVTYNFEMSNFTHVSSKPSGVKIRLDRYLCSVKGLRLEISLQLTADVMKVYTTRTRVQVTRAFYVDASCAHRKSTSFHDLKYECHRFRETKITQIA